jgi:EAL and modified HD-GYP domain-containing signal transduction protein
MATASGIVTYSPLIDRRQDVVGVQFFCHASTPELGVAAMDELILRWPHETFPVVLDLANACMDDSFASLEFPGNALLDMHGMDRSQSGWLQCTNGHRPVTCMTTDSSPPESGDDGSDVAVAERADTKIALHISRANTHIEFNNAVQYGAQYLSGWSFLRKRGRPGKDGLATAGTILQLLDLVAKDADFSKIEAVLKRDVVLGYRLVALVNSAAYGLSVEIESYQHAITMLGMAKLRRWLSVLLVTCGGKECPTALIRTALIRAAFMEEIGRELGYKQQSDDLFLCGAFSLLENILNAPFSEILAKVSIHENIAEALIHRADPFGPLLNLIEAIEQDDLATIKKVRDSLGLTAEQVNAALLVAVKTGLAADLD